MKYVSLTGAIKHYGVIANTIMDNDKIEWVPIEKVVEKLSYDNLKEYFKTVLSMIKEK